MSYNIKYILLRLYTISYTTIPEVEVKGGVDINTSSGLVHLKLPSCVKLRYYPISHFSNRSDVRVICSDSQNNNSNLCGLHYSCVVATLAVQTWAGFHSHCAHKWYVEHQFQVLCTIKCNCHSRHAQQTYWTQQAQQTHWTH